MVEPVQVAGSLLLRDGLPIIDSRGAGYVKGTLLTFLPDRAAEAYDRISAMEPDKHYRWYEAEVNGALANVLVGRSPTKGNVVFEEEDWNGWTDPLFTAALDVVEETLNSQEFEWNLKPLFRLQMAYLLLWSSIERYVSLCYHLGDKVTDKVGQLAHESAFAESLLRYVESKREVYRADRPGEKELLHPDSPEKSLRWPPASRGIPMVQIPVVDLGCRAGFPFGLITWLAASEATMRLAGTILQVCGLGTVIYGIDQTRKLFGLTGLLSVPGEWLKRLPPYRRDAITIYVGPAAELNAAGRAYLETGPPMHATVEQRLEWLESYAKELRKRHDRRFDELDQSIRKHTEALAKSIASGS